VAPHTAITQASCHAVGVTSLPPGPSEPPSIQTARWLLRPISFMESCRRRFGDSFSVTFMGFQTPMVMLSDPEAVQALYTNPKHALPPGRTIALLPVMGPRSVLLLEGPEHLARRKVMLPPFHGERMQAYEETVREIAVREIESWRPGAEISLHPRMQAVTLEVILRAVFGVTNEQRRERLRELLPQLLDSTSSVSLQFRVLLSRRFERMDPLGFLRELSAEIDDLLFAEIAERRADPELDRRQDILSLLALARFEDGEGMSDQELRDQLVTLLLAGHETTATALAWSADLLTRNPHAMQRLTAEVDAGDDDSYLRAVISESLRLRPVVPLAGRRLTSDLQVNGSTLPAGTDVTPAIWLTHTRADLYPDPYAFRPERFLDERPTTYGWVPFGGGVRRCLGAAFAEFEMRVVLTELLRRRSLEAVSAHAERVTRRNVTFSPRQGTRIRTRVRPATSRSRTNVQDRSAGAPVVGTPAA
jgi:cytochrome P450 family 135